MYVFNKHIYLSNEWLLSAYNIVKGFFISAYGIVNTTQDNKPYHLKIKNVTIVSSKCWWTLIILKLKRCSHAGNVYSALHQLPETCVLSCPLRSHIKVKHKTHLCKISSCYHRGTLAGCLIIFTLIWDYPSRYGTLQKQTSKMHYNR